MYTERDMRQINARLRKNALVLAPVLAALLGVYVWALTTERLWLAMIAGPLLFVAVCYGILAYLWPNLRYRGFLRDMEAGLSRELRGTIVEISETPQLQDGAMVLPVRIFLDDKQDEHIVYLNASKRDMLPGVGAAVRLSCFGRHIRAAEAL